MTRKRAQSTKPNPKETLEQLKSLDLLEVSTIARLNHLNFAELAQLAHEPQSAQFIIKFILNIVNGPSSKSAEPPAICRLGKIMGPKIEGRRLRWIGTCPHHSL